MNNLVTRPLQGTPVKSC